MAKYRKKPVVIEAVKLTRKYADVVVSWIGDANIYSFNLGEFSEDSCYIEIKTLKGIMTADEGDYIIKGVEGEFRPCKPDIFEATYDKLDEKEDK